MNLNREISRRFIERAEALNYKGKKRDDAALDFVCGAACALEAAGNPEDARKLGLFASMLVSVRGYTAIVQAANTTDEERRDLSHRQF